MVKEEIIQKSKEKFYRGIEIEELKQMDLRKFAKLLKSRSRRMILRNYDVVDRFTKKCEKRFSKNRPVRTHLRNLVVVPKMIGRTIFVYNGKEFVKLNVTNEMLGHRLGEFSLTRKIAKHTKAGVGATKGSKSVSKK